MVVLEKWRRKKKGVYLSFLIIIIFRKEK